MKYLFKNMKTDLNCAIPGHSLQIVRDVHEQHQQSSVT